MENEEGKEEERDMERKAQRERMAIIKKWRREKKQLQFSALGSLPNGKQCSANTELSYPLFQLHVTKTTNNTESQQAFHANKFK